MSRHRRAFLRLVAGAIPALSASAAPAGEFPLPAAGEAVAAGLTEAERAGVAARLERLGLVMVGEPRRRGRLIVAVAVAAGGPQRIVLDGASGAIVGQRRLVGRTTGEGDPE